MKKTKISVLSAAIALVLSSCGSNQAPSNNNTDGNTNNDQSSSIIPVSYESKAEITNDNFTLLMPNNLSSMSDNCKQYVDDMRAQQKKLIEEKGEDADYYINDLYGLDGVDLTKGVLPSTSNYQDNTGGYRDGTTENDYLDPVGADYEKGEKSDESNHTIATSFFDIFIGVIGFNFV